MVLSKDDVNAIEEVQELTTAQKRRLRRKKLKAARAESFETNIKTKKDLFDLKNTNTSKQPPANHEQQGSHKKQIHICDTQILNETKKSISKEPTLIKNQRSKYKETILPKESKPLIETHDLTTNKNLNFIPEYTHNQELKGHYSHLINSCKNLLENIKKPTLPLKVVKERSECENQISNQHKSKSKNINGNKDIISADTSLVENKKDKSNDSLSTESSTAVNKKLIEKQTDVSHNPSCNDSHSTKQNCLTKIKTPIPSKNNHGSIEENTLSYKIGNHSKISENIHLKNKGKKIPRTLENSECIEIKAPTLGKQDMGKVKDTAEPQKQQKITTKIEAKQGDTPSTDEAAKSREEIKAAREAKKLAKQRAKKKNDTVDEVVEVKTDSLKTNVKETAVKSHDVSVKKTVDTKPDEPVSNEKYKETIPLTGKGKAQEEVKKKSKEDIKSSTMAETNEEASKSKAELRAERRAKQEAQRAAKQVSVQKTTTVPAPEVRDKEPIKNKEEKSPKPKSAEKAKVKIQSIQKTGWFQHLCVEKDKASIDNIPINSNLHPAVVRLGVQLATRVITGSNARCIALLDAIKKMVRDYSVPARTEVARGLQAALAAAAAHLGLSARVGAAAAAQANALKHCRRLLTQLPPNIDEFDAKKQLQEEIDRYIREQIDMAGEAISLTLRNKISPGDNILTYGCSSLIERVLCSAWEAGVRFRATVVGARSGAGRGRGEEMARRLRARSLPATYVDISAVSYVMTDVQKVFLGAGALLAHGAALGAAGCAQVALLARARNVPVLVACETHKFSERTHLDPLVAQDIGDPDELIDLTDDSCPLRDWRSMPHLSLLNVTYDVTPPSLITAVVTELGILPCTSAPVVLRFKQSEYGI